SARSADGARRVVAIGHGRGTPMEGPWIIAPRAKKTPGTRPGAGANAWPETEAPGQAGRLDRDRGTPSAERGIQPAQRVAQVRRAGALDVLARVHAAAGGHALLLVAARTGVARGGDARAGLFDAEAVVGLARILGAAARGLFRLVLGECGRRCGDEGQRGQRGGGDQNLLHGEPRGLPGEQPATIRGTRAVREMGAVGVHRIVRLVEITGTAVGGSRRARYRASA